MQVPSDQVAAELLRRLRGSRSQVAFSRRLGYRSNVAAAWEAGRRWPTASQVLVAARRVGVDVDGGLRRFYGVPTPFLDQVDPATPEGITAFLQDNRRDRSVVDLAHRSGYSRFQISRWYRGEAEPRVPELLGLIEASTERLLDWLAILVDPASLPSVSAAWSRLESARSLFWRMPHAQLVLLALTLDGYRALPTHDDHWLAATLDLELYQVVGALEALVATGQVARDGDHYVLGTIRTVDTRRHPHAGQALNRYWAERALREVDAPDTSWSWNAFAVSEADREQIIELYRATYRRMRAMVAVSEPPEALVLVQQAVVRLSRPP